MKQIVLGGGAPKKSPGGGARGKKPGARPPKRRRRRTGRQTLNYLLLLIVAAAIMVTLSVTVLFNVKTVITDGVTKYAPQAVIDASGVKEGDNLLRVSERAVRKRLLERFPYIEDVSLRRALPDKLVLQVTEAVVLGACQTDEGYVVVGATGRILETGVSQPPDDAMAIYGMSIHEPKVGRILGKGFNKEQEEQKKEEETAFSNLTYLVEAVQETSFPNITLVDFSDPLNMAVVYDGRVLIELGSVAELSYKLEFVDYVLNEQLPEGYQGTIDASYCSTSKSVVTSAGDISQELETRRLRAEAEMLESVGSPENPEESGAPKRDASTDPNLETLPKKESSSSSGDSSASGSSSQQENASSESGSGSSADDAGEEESQSSSMIGPYSADDLEVKAPPPGASKAKEDPEDAPSSSGGD